MIVLRTRKTIRALAEEEEEILSNEAINELNEWSVKVNRRCKTHEVEKTPKPAVPEIFVIKSEKQLDRLLAKHHHLAATERNHAPTVRAYRHP